METPKPSESVSAYLSSTRFMLPRHPKSDVSDDSLIYYQELIDYVNVLSKSLGMDVKFNIVKSDSLRSEAIAIDGDMYIIHDQYLGQTINMLNRLFIYGASHRTKLTYFHKIASQILSRYGFYEESIFAAQKYQNYRDDMDHKAKQEQDGSQIHSIFTKIQELYVVLHEHAHHLFRKNKVLYSDVSKDVQEWIKNFGEKESNAEGVISSLINSDLPDSEKEYYKSNISNFIEQGERNSKICQEISKRSDLVEEFCCDRMAILHIVPYLSSLNHIETIDAVKAIVLCFLHLRTIQILEAICSLEENYNFEGRENQVDIKENIYWIFYNARLHHIKEFSYDLFISSEDEFKIVHSAVSEMMSLHTDEIFAPAEKVMRILLYSREIRENMQNQFNYIREHMSESQHIQRVVSAILHFLPVNR